MDPRHPELAVSRIKELIKQYDRIEKDMAKATTSAQLGQLEREGGLVIQEICLVAPRIHEAMMQTSRQRRHDLAHGTAFGYKPEEKVGEYIKATIGIEEKPVEKPVHKWSSAEKVVEAKERLEQAIANSDVEKPVEKSSTQIRKEAVFKKGTTPKKTTKKKTTKKKAE